jgi:hypothetical protein
MDQRKLVDKVDIAVSDLVSDGGYLNPMQADRFIRKVIDQPTMLNSFRVERMTSPKMKVPKIGIGSRILRASPGSGVELPSSERFKATTEQVQLTTKELIAETHLPYDFLEDNIERDNVEASIMDLMAQRVAIDLEELAILGSTDFSAGDTGYDGSTLSADNAKYLSQMDGILKQITSNTVDVSGDSLTMQKEVCKQAKMSMPSKYFRDLSAMRYYVSYDNETEYVDTLADRATPLGDSAAEGMRRATPYGIRLEPNSWMPDTYLTLFNPQNVIWGVQRQISIETDRDIRARVFVIVLTLRVDMKFEEEDATVKVSNIVSPTA